ncbi:uncharacterized protein DUF559 [Nocardioides albertanoniae]|uniref:Uncharacterized protein DUF559 n=1 Tax=Nocardioides albertanoniae TaxID=1175486 RepID=A0A543AB28_9ACTN|nr:DUF559 domain-containing protein [Nocardioides albertanoniae]TQL69720.1 uncharacterized protein DUF559 [Nocardioides albertanoniae]
MNDDEKAVARAAVEAAERLRGVVSGLSAALLWGWSLKHVPSRPEVSIPKTRRVRRKRAQGVVVRRLDIPPCDIEGPVTTKLRTALDCLRRLPFDEALCVADSALRLGVERDELVAAAERTLGPGAGNVRRVAHLAHGGAANAFESCLRVIALQVDGLDVEPQVRIAEPDFLGRVDLADRRLRIIVEADSFEFHGTRRALVEDAGRYNRFVAAGWIVLRFTWEDVMLHPEVVREVLEGAVADRVRSMPA